MSADEQQAGRDEPSRTWSWLRRKFKKLISSSKGNQSPEGISSQQQGKGRRASHSGPLLYSSANSSEPSSGRPSTSSESSGGSGDGSLSCIGYGAAYAHCDSHMEFDGRSLSRDDANKGNGSSHIAFLAPRPSMRRSSCSSALPQRLLADGTAAPPLLPAALQFGCPVGPRLAKARSVQMLLGAGSPLSPFRSRRLSQVMPQASSSSSGGSSSCGFEALDIRISSSSSSMMQSRPLSTRSSCSGLAPTHALRYCDLVVALQHPGGGGNCGSNSGSGSGSGTRISSKGVGLEGCLPRGASVDNSCQSEGIDGNGDGSRFTVTNTRRVAAWGGQQQERSVCLRRTISYAQSRSSRLCSVSEIVRTSGGDAGLVGSSRAAVSDPLPKIAH